MNDFIITADASKVSGAEFFRALSPKPNAEMLAEKAQALRDHQAAVQASYKLPTLWEQIQRREDLQNQYEARLREIDQRYAEQLTEVHGDPLRRVA